MAAVAEARKERNHSLGAWLDDRSVHAKMVGAVVLVALVAAMLTAWP